MNTIAIVIALCTAAASTLSHYIRHTSESFPQLATLLSSISDFVHPTSASIMGDAGKLAFHPSVLSTTSNGPKLQRLHPDNTVSIPPRHLHPDVKTAIRQRKTLDPTRMALPPLLEMPGGGYQCAVM